MNKTVIYVSGYGRSGSTLLAKLLGSHSRIFTAGELINYIGIARRPDTICSCGRIVRDCSFWSRTIQRFNDQFPNVEDHLRDLQRVESILHWVKFIGGGGSFGDDRYQELHHHIIDSIFHQLPVDVGYIVDSSKTTLNRCLRPILLSTIGGFRVKVIHIVRDGRGCLWSMLKGTDTGLLKGRELKQQSSLPILRTTIHWMLANMAAHWFQIRQPADDYCRIRYEDLVDQPEKTFSVLGNFLGVDFSRQVDLVTNGGEMDTGHIIAGNRMRSSTNLCVTTDMAWIKGLKVQHEILFWLVNWPLMMYYGYRLKNPPA